MAQSMPAMRMETGRAGWWRWPGGAHALTSGGLRAFDLSGATPSILDASGLAGLRVERGTTNLLPNPTAGLAAAGWSAGGANGLARVTDLPSMEGLPDGVSTGLQLTCQDSASLAFVASSISSGPHAFSAWVYVPSDWDGGQIEVRADWGFSGASVTGAHWADMGARDRWQRLWQVADVGADVDGTPLIRTNALPTPGRSVLVAAAQLEAQPLPTSYADGSLGAGYAWTGSAHASASVREAGHILLAHPRWDLLAGGAAFWVRPSWGAGNAVDGTVWHLSAMSGDAVELRSNAGAWELVAESAGDVSTATIAMEHASEERVLLAATWTARRLEIWRGEARSSAPRLRAPGARRAGMLTLGGHPGAPDAQADAVLGPACAATAALSPADVVALARGGRII